MSKTSIYVVLAGRNVLTTADNGYTAYEPVAACFDEVAAHDIAASLVQARITHLQISSTFENFKRRESFEKKVHAYHVIAPEVRELLEIREPREEE